MKKKLVILTTHFGTNYSGGSTATCEIFSRIESDFEQVIVIGTALGNHPFQDVKFVPYRNWIHAIRLLKAVGSDSTVYYGDFYNSFFFILARVPFFFTYHDNWPELRELSLAYRVKSFFYVPIYEWIFKKASHIFVVSSKKQVAVKKFNSEVSLIRNGFQPTLTQPAKRKQAILMVGNIDHRKYAKAIQLFKLLDPAFTQVDIYGHVNDQAIYDQVDSFSFVQMKGFDINIPYGEYQLLLHTSLMENMPIVFCEALNSETPIMAFDVGGASELINAENGVLIAPYDILGLKQAIEDVVSGKKSFHVDNGILADFSWDLASKGYLERIETMESKKKMSQMENEIPLTTDWLNARHPYDLEAKNPRLLNDFLTLMRSLENPRIADVGCGTGNHVLSLAKLLDKDTTWYLVERELELLNEAKRRIKDDFNTILEESEGSLLVSYQGHTITFYFCNELIASFLHHDSGINAMIASALFDLFTIEEFNDLLALLRKKEIIIYSIMNYTGVGFRPADSQDPFYIDCFEAHMSRPLAKGRPMGVDTMEIIRNTVEGYDNIRFEFEDSIWKIDETGDLFLRMNLQFYREGISSVLKIEDDGLFNQWFSTKLELAQAQKLRLEVSHQDFIIKYV